MSADRVEIAVVGSLNLDVSLTVATFPAPGETVVGSDLVRGSGGKGANQAVAAARLGRRVGLIGMVGDDSDGRWLLEQLAADDVDVARVRRTTEAPTGTAFIEVEAGGENRIVIVPGANMMVPAEAIADPLVSEAAVVLTQMETPSSLVAALAAMPRGGRLIVNPAPARSGVAFGGVDVLIPNRGELVTSAGAGEVGSTVDHGQLATLASKVPGQPAVVVVTLGADGALVIERDSRGRMRTEHISAEPVDAVDTTAAGDSFCGAFADATCGGAHPIEAARWATRAAAVTVTRRGAQASLPTAADIGHARQRAQRS